jgi:hypothetical protein
MGKQLATFHFEFSINIDYQRLTQERVFRLVCKPMAHNLVNFPPIFLGQIFTILKLQEYEFDITKGLLFSKWP